MKRYQVFLINEITNGADATTPIFIDFVQAFGSLEKARAYALDRSNSIIIDRETLRAI